MRRAEGEHSEEPVWVDVLEVSPEGRHQPARSPLRQVVPVRPLSWCGVWGWHCLAVLVWRGASWGGVPWGCVRVSFRYAPCGGLLLRGHQMGRGGGWGATRLLKAGGLCHFFVRTRVACVVLPLLWCVLRIPVVCLRHSQGGEPCGALVWLVV